MTTQVNNIEKSQVPLTWQHIWRARALTWLHIWRGRWRRGGEQHKRHRTLQRGWRSEQGSSFKERSAWAPVFLGFCNCLEKRAIKSRIWLGSPGSDNLSLALLLFPVQAHRGQGWQEKQIRFWRNWDSRLELSLRPSQLLEYGQGDSKLPLQLIRGHFAPCRHYLPRAITWSKANLN